MEKLLPVAPTAMPAHRSAGSCQRIALWRVCLPVGPKKQPPPPDAGSTSHAGDPSRAFKNQNRIFTDGFSNRASEKLYRLGWPDEPAVKALYEGGLQCGGCAFFAPFNADWGLCCHAASRHHLETVFEHFTCPHHVDDGWESHSFEARPMPRDRGMSPKKKPTGRRSRSS